MVPISQSSAKQRAGRAGRTCEGEVWRLYTEAQHAALAAEQLAEIHRTDLANVVLCLKQIGEQYNSMHHRASRAAHAPRRPRRHRSSARS